MSEIIIADKYNVSNAHIYDLQESVKASKYPMLASVQDAKSDMTNTVKSLGSSNKGEGHDQFLTGVVVNFDLTATNKFWQEAERYRFLYFVSSQSTMHRISKFDLKEHSSSYVDKTVLDAFVALRDKYEKEPTLENKRILLYNMPSGIILTARLTTNYRQLKTIYSQRKSHELPEWIDFCNWIYELPSFNELCLGE